MPDSRPMYLRLTVGGGVGERVITVVAYEPAPDVGPGDRLPPDVAEALIALMTAALRKLRLDAEPCGVVVRRVRDDEVWCDVETAARPADDGPAPIAVASGSPPGGAR